MHKNSVIIESHISINLKWILTEAVVVVVVVVVAVIVFVDPQQF